MHSRRRGLCLALLLCVAASAAAAAKNTHTSHHGERAPLVVSEGRQRNTDGSTYFVVRESCALPTCHEALPCTYPVIAVPEAQASGFPVHRAVWGWHRQCAAQRAEGLRGGQAPRLHLRGAAHGPVVSHHPMPLPVHRRCSALDPYSVQHWEIKGTQRRAPASSVPSP